MLAVISFVRKCHSSSDLSQLLKNSIVQRYLQHIIKNTPSDLDKTVLQLIEAKKTIESDIETLKKMKDDDADMLKLITEESETFSKKINVVDEEIVSELLPKLDLDRDIVLEVTAGVGGREAMLFAGDLFKMYAGFCNYKRWNWETHEQDVPEGGGLRHGSAYMSGKGVGILIQEAGVHRVQRIPATEKSGRIHTSTVTVAILPQPTAVEVIINDSDITMETKTSSGAGGQHVNKTKSCVRITHIPTGIVIENQTDRSQIRNKQIALQRLRAKLYQLKLEGSQDVARSSRKEQVGMSLRSEKIRTYNFNQDRVTDHRGSGITLHNIEAFLKGGPQLEQLIQNLVNRSRQQQFLTFIEQSLIKNR